MDGIRRGLVSIRCQAHALVPAGLWGGTHMLFTRALKREAAKSCLAIFTAFNTRKIMQNLPTLACNFGQVLIYVYYECFPRHVYGVKTRHKHVYVTVFPQRRPAFALFKRKVLK